MFKTIQGIEVYVLGPQMRPGDVHNNDITNALQSFVNDKNQILTPCIKTNKGIYADGISFFDENEEFV